MNRIETQTRRRLLRIEADQRARIERDALAGSLHRTAALAQLRGEEVEQVDGRVRIWSRDGLRHLYEGSELDLAEYEAGLFYRACLETVGAMASSDMARIARTVFPGAASWRAWRALSLGQMDGMAQSSREAEALLRVAGEGRAVRSISQGGADYKLNVKALRAILARIAEQFAL
jgi:hypothetical protein